MRERVRERKSEGEREREIKREWERKGEEDKGVFKQKKEYQYYNVILASIMMYALNCNVLHCT